jgi:hypothetical protein
MFDNATLSVIMRHRQARRFEHDLIAKSAAVIHPASDNSAP